MYVVDFAAEFIPHLRDGVFVILVLDLDEDRGQAGFGDAGDQLHLAELLNGRLREPTSGMYAAFQLLVARLT